MADLSLIPPHRLGDLLAGQRRAAAKSVHELADGSPFSAVDLVEIELGQRLLSDRAVAELVQLYGVPPSRLAPGRTTLVIDLADGLLLAGDLDHPLPPGASVDEVLERYLTLLCALRGLPSAAGLTLRHDDLAVLAEGLERSIAEVERRLGVLMLGAGLSLVERLRGRLVVPAAGMLVGLTAVGALVLAPLASAARVRPVAGDALPSSGPRSLGVGAPVAVGTAVPGAGLVSAPYEPGDPASVGAAAEAYVTYPWAAHLPGWRVVYDAPRQGFRGTTDTAARRITIHVEPDDTPYEVAEVLAHELGHALDVEHLSGADRDRWLIARGLAGPWWPGNAEADFSVGAGDFAEAVAALLVGSASDATAGAFTAADLALAESLLPPGGGR